MIPNQLAPPKTDGIRCYLPIPNAAERYLFISTSWFHLNNVHREARYRNEIIIVHPTHEFPVVVTRRGQWRPPGTAPAIFGTARRLWPSSPMSRVPLPINRSHLRRRPYDTRFLHDRSRSSFHSSADSDYPSITIVSCCSRYVIRIAPRNVRLFIRFLNPN